jgi:chlorophyll synthase
MPGRWGLYIANLWTFLSLSVASALGTWGFVAACIGLALAWAYSAPPFRLKLNGWWGNAACAICYEGLAWFTGAAVMAGGAMPDGRIVALALLYSAGAHGIMTLNDFKSVLGDRQLGIDSLPVQLGVRNAAIVASSVMTVAQVIVVVCLCFWGFLPYAASVAGLTAIQLVLMRKFVANPVERATWFSGLGVTLYVIGMMISAFALHSTQAVGY